MSDRPLLSIQTTYVTDDERPAGRELGLGLYAMLNRRCEAPLTQGTRIPIRIGASLDHVDPGAAQHVVIAMVLGRRSLATHREVVQNAIVGWRTQGDVAVVIHADDAWQDEIRDTPGVHWVDGDDAEAIEVVIRLAAHGLEGSTEPAPLYVTQRRGATERTAADVIHDHAEVASTLFEATWISAHLPAIPGATAMPRGVLISIRGAGEPHDPALMWAKRLGLPTLVVRLPSPAIEYDGPYDGNSAVVNWSGDPDLVLRWARVAWLRHLWLLRDATRLVTLAQMPANTMVITRPPELLDFPQGPHANRNTMVVLHPDPERPMVERRFLQEKCPQIRLATPTTSTRGLLTPTLDSIARVPLRDTTVGLSLSRTPDVDGPEGFVEAHVEDAIVHLTRSLLAAGADLAYGGDFRANGYTHQLASIVADYRRHATRRPAPLHSYLAACFPLPDPPDAPISLHHLRDPAWATQRRVPLPDGDSTEGADALCVSDMRRILAHQVHAAVLVGGAAVPVDPTTNVGYRGRYPGLVEEAWRALEAGNPMYVVGGFGGAAGLVAQVLRGASPEALTDGRWAAHPGFSSRIAAIDDDPSSEALGLPPSMEDLVARIRDLGADLLTDNDRALEMNGLTVSQNAHLLHTRDPAMITALVMTGLRHKRQAASRGKTSIELVRGQLSQAEDLDVIAVAPYHGIPLAGAATAIDPLLCGEEATLGDQREPILTALSMPDVDARWLYLHPLGDNVSAIPAPRVHDASAGVVDTVRRHGFHRVGIVVFGNRAAEEMGAMATEMMNGGLLNLPDTCTLTWFEPDPSRFASLQDILAKRGNLDVTVVVPPDPIFVESRPHPIRVQVMGPLDQMRITVTPPAHLGHPTTGERPMNVQTLEALTVGSHSHGRSVPDLQDLIHRGRRIAEILFDEAPGPWLERMGQRDLVVTHDTATAPIPFETLLTAVPKAQRPSLVRRLVVHDAPRDQLFRRTVGPDKLRVLLVVNPTEDLPSAVAEGEEVERILGDWRDFDVTSLHGPDATVDHVRDALPTVDIFHYAGHGFYRGPGADQSGLRLSGGDLTLDTLGTLPRTPRLVYASACESARVRSEPGEPLPPQSFAEHLLLSGVEAFVGTYWLVKDDSAARFSTEVYNRLALGDTLEEAVCSARGPLRENDHPDWVNFLLYGNGRYRLSASQW